MEAFFSPFFFHQGRVVGKPINAISTIKTCLKLTEVFISLIKANGKDLSKVRAKNLLDKYL